MEMYHDECDEHLFEFVQLCLIVCLHTMNWDIGIG